MMSSVRKLIEDILPSKKIFYRLQELLNSISTNENKKSILISIEKSNRSREYCELTLDQLELIYVLYPKINQSFYECICGNNPIKAYIDFEYMIENNSSIDLDRAIRSCLKILFFYTNNSSKSSINTEIPLSLVLNQFLVLNASTSSKKSYHLIHANPTILFENTKTLGVYIKAIFQCLLFATAIHVCTSFNLRIDSNTNSIQHLISLLSEHVTQLRVNCSNCFILNNEISAADVAHLIVRNKKNQWLLSVDLCVYYKNQQFRLYDCTKNGLNNPLITTSDYPFEQIKSHSYFDILRKSLVTDITDIHVPLIISKDEHLFITQTASRLSYEPIHFDDRTDKHYNHKPSEILEYTGSNLSSSCKQENRTPSIPQKQQTPTFINTMIFDKYLPFINSIITQDNKYIGRIGSCVQGNRNRNKIFFNIIGDYRFCPKIGTHHKRNCTAIIIDILNNTYAIRCKDPQCDNTLLTWYQLDKQ